MVRMTLALHEATDMRIPLDRAMVRDFCAALIMRSDGLALVVDGEEGPAGMLCASIERTPISTVTVAVEHGWYCGPEVRGAGKALLGRYIAWAKDQGAWGARMSTPPAKGFRGGLSRMGFRPAETAWVMVF